MKGSMTKENPPLASSLPVEAQAGSVSPKTVDEGALPAPIRQALQANPQAWEIFLERSWTHRQKYIQWITSAKREATQLRRVQKVIETLTLSQPLNHARW